MNSRSLGDNPKFVRDALEVIRAHIMPVIKKAFNTEFDSDSEYTIKIADEGFMLEWDDHNKSFIIYHPESDDAELRVVFSTAMRPVTPKRHRLHSSAGTPRMKPEEFVRSMVDYILAGNAVTGEYIRREAIEAGLKTHATPLIYRVFDEVRKH